MYGLKTGGFQLVTPGFAPVWRGLRSLFQTVFPKNLRFFGKTVCTLSPEKQIHIYKIGFIGSLQNRRTKLKLCAAVFVI
jgi:hypothetical protein